MPGDIRNKLRADEGPATTSSRTILSPAVPLDDFLEAIDFMRSCGSYDWADDTLRGIYDTVERTQTVTSGQLGAVRKIAESREVYDSALGVLGRG